MKIFKSTTIMLILIIVLALNAGTTFAAGNANQHFDKHYISDTEKNELSQAASKSNLNDKISELYPSITNFTLAEPLKLYRLEEDDFANKYNGKNNLTSYITNYYRIIECIKSDSGKTIGAVIFNKVNENDLKKINATKDLETKDQALKFYKDNENTWYVSSIGTYNSPAGLDFITNFSEIQRKLDNAGINKINDIFVLDSNGILPLMIYVQTPGEEYALPIASEMVPSNFKTGNIYKLKDLVSSQINAAKEAEKIPANEIKAGGSNVNLPQLKPVTKIGVNFPQIFIIAISAGILLILLVLIKHKPLIFTKNK